MFDDYDNEQNLEIQFIMEKIDATYERFYNKADVKYILCNPEKFVTEYFELTKDLLDTFNKYRTAMIPIEYAQKVEDIINIKKLLWNLINKQYKDETSEFKKDLYAYLLDSIKIKETKNSIQIKLKDGGNK